MQRRLLMGDRGIEKAKARGEVSSLSPEERKAERHRKAMAKYMAKKRQKDKEARQALIREEKAQQAAEKQQIAKNLEEQLKDVPVGKHFTTELQKKSSLNELDFGRVLSDALTVIEPSQVNVEEFFSFLELNKYNDTLYKGITMTRAMAEGIKNHLMAMKHGTYSAVPLLCKGGLKCPMVSQCWFAHKNDDGQIDHEKSTYPLFKPCPVESGIIELKIRQYISEHLGNNMNITPSVMNLISRLAELDIYEIRADILLSTGSALSSDGQNLLITVVDAINQKSGEAFFTVKEHPALVIKEKLQNQKDRLMKSLLSTPEAKLAMAAKLKGASEKSDQTNVLTQIATALRRNASKVDSYWDVDEVDTEDL